MKYISRQPHRRLWTVGLAATLSSSWQLVLADDQPVSTTAPARTQGAPLGIPITRDSSVRRVQDMPMAPSPTPPPATMPGMMGANPSLPYRVDPTQAGNEPVDLTVPAADRPIGGGGSTLETQATEAAAASTANEPKRLQNLLGFEESPVKIYGWIQNSFTGNANGHSGGINNGVQPNYKANQWMGNQYYLVVENPLEQTDEVNFGFRVDNLFGNDWQFNFMQGLYNGAFKNGAFAGYDTAQMYAEVHLPDPTGATKGMDIKGGRWYTLAGYEQVPAIARPLLSVPYMFNYGQPFTHFGALTTWHITDKINFYNGAINGWDRWINQNYKWGYIGGFSWTGNEDKTSLAFTTVTGPQQYPRFLPSNQPIYATGYINVPSVAGTTNQAYSSNNRTIFTTVLTHKWTDKLTQVVETDQAWENNVPGLASPVANGVVQNASSKNATWYSFGNWFLYNFNDKLTGVWRSEVFWDTTGVRTYNVQDGQFRGDRFYEQTLGLIYKPIPNVWIRPEARYDWTQYTPYYDNGTKKSQLTLGFDVILLF